MTEQLGLTLIRTEGINLLFGCPVCGKKDHLSIRSDNGLWKCFTGCGGGGGNPYLLLRRIMGMDAQASFKLLEEHGLIDAAETNRKKPPPAKGSPKTKPSEREEISQKDLLAFCEVKGLDPKAFMLLKPEKRKGKREFLIPAYNPKDYDHVNGWIRVGIDGQDCPIKYKDNNGKWCEKLEKYPLLTGSKAGLVGVHHATESYKENTIIFAEGWKDAVKALEFGYIAVAGSNGAGTWRDEWLGMFKGLIVHIIFDTDAAGNGGPVKNKKTGKVTIDEGGAVKAANAISGVAKELRVIRLPYKYTEDHGKDLYDYLAEHTKEQFEIILQDTKLYVPEVPPPGTANNKGFLQLPDDNPDTIAYHFEKWSQKDGNVRHRFNSIDQWSIYYKDKYQRVEDSDEIESYIRRFLLICKFKTRDKEGKSKYVRASKKHKTPTFIKSIMLWLRDMQDVHLLPGQKAPCSLDGSLSTEDVLAMQNCILDLVTGKTVPVSDQFYTFNYMMYNYDPKAISDKWGRFLWDITGGDTEIMQLMQMWAGYLLMSTTKYQKFLLCVGDGANGKFVFFDTLAAAIGKDNVSNVPLACFADTSKIFSTYGKAVNMSNENTRDIESSVESIIKEYVGGDKMLWRQLYNEAFSAYPTAKLMFATNELPIIRDPSDGIWRRMLYLPFDVQIPEDQQNKNLARELQEPEELSGILNWMIEGRELLIKNDGFIVPKTCQEKLNQYRDESNSARLFVNEFLEVNPDFDEYLTKSDVYRKYKEWCADNGRRPKNNSHFGQTVQKCFAMSKSCRPLINGKKVTAYEGIKYQEGMEFGHSNSDLDTDGHSNLMF
jgi:P4 family phage/plasmid primase-like protien